MLLTCLIRRSSLVENSRLRVSHATAIMSLLDCMASFSGLMQSVWHIDDMQICDEIENKPYFAKSLTAMGN